MSKSNASETGWLALLFNNTNFPDIGDATGLRGSLTAGNLYVSLHTADPGEAGDQTTNEIGYTSYARVAVARSPAGWTVLGNSVSPVANISFPLGTGGSGTATHFGIGTSLSGPGTLIYSGTVSPSIVTGSGVTPILSTATTITED